MVRVVATARGYDGSVVREVGEVFDFDGKLGSWMAPYDGRSVAVDEPPSEPAPVLLDEREVAAEPHYEVEAPEATAEPPEYRPTIVSEHSVSEEVAALEAEVAKFDHDGDGKAGGSRKGGLARRKQSGGLRKRA